MLRGAPDPCVGAPIGITIPFVGQERAKVADNLDRVHFGALFGHRGLVFFEARSADRRTDGPPPTEE